MLIGVGHKRKHSDTDTGRSGKLMKVSRELMPLLHKAKIQGNYSYLLEQLDVTYLIDDLFSESIIDDDDMECLQIERNSKGRKAATKKLLDKLFRRGERAFDVFRDVLYKNGYQRVREQLELDSYDEPSMTGLKLHKACQKETLDRVKELIENGEDVKEKDSLDRMPIFYCCISRVDPVKKLNYLLELGVLDETYIDELVYQSCKFGQIETVEYLLKYIDERSIKFTDGEYEIMLLCSALSETQTIAKIKLIEQKLGVRDITKYLLHLACFFSKFEVVEELSEIYPSVINTPDDSGFTPLHYCYLSAIDSLNKIELLVNKGAKLDIHIENELFLGACEEATFENVKSLVEKGADVNCRDENGESPLLYCSRSSKDPILKIEFLREKGTVIERDLTDIRSEDEVMLCESCEYGTLETVQYFLKKGVNVNCRDGNDQTPAFYCCRSNEGPIEKLSSLKDKGAKFNVTDKDYTNLLHEACHHGGVETIQHLIANNLDRFRSGKDNCTNFLEYCCLSESGACTKLKYLLSLSNFAISTDGDGLLHLASLKGGQSVVRFLIEELHLDVNLVDKFDKTPLYKSCRSKKHPIAKIKLLISRGADLDRKYKDGDTLLHVACRFGNLNIVRHLAMKTKLNLIAENDFNETPLQHCKRSKIQSVRKVSFLENEISKTKCITQP
ncbi:hypothetical protein SNE40_022020 [Patella caerulea]|uniref:CARD domain-containing protein n=1 Tax=Patella caerulea TaxID=87958 RepID=A0AAN8GJF5_PATCE